MCNFLHGCGDLNLIEFKRHSMTYNKPLFNTVPFSSSITAKYFAKRIIRKSMAFKCCYFSGLTVSFGKVHCQHPM
uniref:Uncharacterized protein n=1 Tax=Anguilla anguilla TaxID=7936 RepID=A0A0E9QHX6_ANGAN